MRVWAVQVRFGSVQVRFGSVRVSSGSLLVRSGSVQVRVWIYSGEVWICSGEVWKLSCPPGMSTSTEDALTGGSASPPALEPFPWNARLVWVGRTFQIIPAQPRFPHLAQVCAQEEPGSLVLTQRVTCHSELLPVFPVQKAWNGVKMVPCYLCAYGSACLGVSQVEMTWKKKQTKEETTNKYLLVDSEIWANV